MILNEVIEILVLVCIFLIAYTFAFYPVVLYIFTKLFKKPVKRDATYQPEVSIVISAYNEEELIADAVESVFNSDYPKEKIKVYVGSDGSTDGTVDILKELKAKYKNLYYYDFPRSGKNQVLNNLVPETNTDIIIYMDADCRCQADTLARVVSNYADKNVGAVIAAMKSIEYVEENDNTGSQGEVIYQKYETYLRKNESLVKSTVSSLGAFYSIRRKFYKPLPNNNVCDDYMPLLDTASMKKRVIFDCDPVVLEVRKKTLTDEFTRRVRIAAGGVATIWEARKLLLWPFYGWFSFFLWSHKVLRYLSPVFMIFIALGTIFLMKSSQLMGSLLILQLIMYLAAFLGWAFEKTTFKMIPFRLPLFFVSMNIGFLMGILRFISGRQNARWERQSK